MHPAFSVIFFTVFSGAGYGVLMALSVGGALGLLPRDTVFALVSFGLALAVVAAGLLSSTWHLGRPERAWRALTQWRTSWLSREGVAAVVTFLPSLALAYVWAFETDASPYFLPLCILTFACSALTVGCTGMIYASLKTVPQWRNGWTVPNYLFFGIATGAVWLWALVTGFADEPPESLGWTALGLLILAWLAKLSYWGLIDADAQTPGPGEATGLERMGTVRVFETPHSQANYLMKEMGFQVARNAAGRLRRYALAVGFFLPLALVAASLFSSGAAALAMMVAAAMLVTFGQLLERWLFFAEAQHVVMSYYGEHCHETV